jgi:hypothetical protein
MIEEDRRQPRLTPAGAPQGINRGNVEGAVKRLNMQRFNSHLSFLVLQVRGHRRVRDSRIRQQRIVVLEAENLHI